MLSPRQVRECDARHVETTSNAFQPAVTRHPPCHLQPPMHVETGATVCGIVGYADEAARTGAQEECVSNTSSLHSAAAALMRRWGRRRAAFDCIRWPRPLDLQSKEGSTYDRQERKCVDCRRCRDECWPAQCACRLATLAGSHVPSSSPQACRAAPSPAPPAR